MTDDQEKKHILMANLERAIEIAVLTHKGTSDKSGAPYILHPPVIFGHYWLPFGAPHSPLAENVACVDFSAGAEGPLAAYRWDGESQLDSAKFVFSD